MLERAEFASEIYDGAAARTMGLAPGQVTVTVHCGSRGFGYQICDDFLALMNKAVDTYGIVLPDRQLACAPLGSPEARAYFGAMCCAVNYAFAPGHAEVPSDFKSIGQPVLIPGDMGRYSFVLTGTERAMRDTFGSTCHGAGRRMSRHQAARLAHGRDVAGELARRDILVMGQTRRTLEEELSEAYKDVSDVVETCAVAGISHKVCRLRPMACIKG
jgi:tRNA-splicing ligase RtcB